MPWRAPASAGEHRIVTVARTVTIPRRFVGPPDSGHGGYTSGLIAAALGNGAGSGGGPVEVTLRRPLPVDRPLQLTADAGRISLHDGDLLLAEAVTATPALDLPAFVPLAWAEKSAASFDTANYAAHHPFPTCFGCGPEREKGDGLRIFPALAGPHLVVWPWLPDDSMLAPADGRLAPEFLWAALDCPSGLAWFHDTPKAPPHVLGRMTAVVHERPLPSAPLIVAGWLIEVDGRKRRSGAVIWDEDGNVVAESLATWIALAGSRSGGPST